MSPAVNEKHYVISHSLVQSVREYILSIPSGSHAAVVPVRLYEAMSELRPLDMAAVIKYAPQQTQAKE